jgi:hypothetical protein
MSDETLAIRGLRTGNESLSPGVSWSAVIAGAFVASALSFALFLLGAGLGLVSVSPWSTNNVSVTTFGALAAAWFLAVQLFAPGVGGYIAGRLRTKWVDVHTDEVYFRDTAHGFLVWAVGAVISALLLASVASSLVSGVAQVGSAATKVAGSALSGPAGQLAGAATSNSYFTDMLFRTDHPAASGDTSASLAEAGRILASATATGDIDAADKTYLSQIVAARTGLSAADADKRVSDVVARAKDAKQKAADAAKTAADAARKTAVYVSLWAFASLLLGAFSASFMATVGGKTRDEHPTST